MQTSKFKKFDLSIENFCKEQNELHEENVSIKKEDLENSHEIVKSKQHIDQEAKVKIEKPKWISGSFRSIEETPHELAINVKNEEQIDDIETHSQTILKFEPSEPNVLSNEIKFEDKSTATMLSAEIKSEPLGERVVTSAKKPVMFKKRKVEGQNLRERFDE
jgi:hypothetical protein